MEEGDKKNEKNNRISIAEFRKKIGKQHSFYSDNEIGKIIDFFEIIGDIIYQNYLKNNHE